MDGQGYLCDYYKSWNQDRYCEILVRRYTIIDDDDIDRCRKLIVLATKYAIKERYAANDQDRNTYLYRISYVDGLLREHICNVVRARVARRG